MTHSLRRRARGVAIGAVALLSASLLWTGSAIADPTNPTTADEAQQAYLDSSHRAGVLNEEVLVAQEKESAAVAAAVAAGEQVTATTTAADAARTQAQESDQEAAAYQAKVNAFANASFRGARLDGVSAILTAGSAEDFLDQATSLDRVAADTQDTLDEAIAARDAAAQAKSQAEAAAAAAAKAKADADAAAAGAQQATADATARKAELDAEAARYQELFDSLSEQERQAAAAAEEQANTAANAAAEAPAEEPAEAASRSEDRTEIAAETSEEPAPSAPAGSGAGAAAVAAALSKVGSPYVYGAAGPSAFDCSGLTSWAWAQAGVSIPRTSGAQAGLPSVPLSQLQPGDLVTYYSPVSHVAMYIGNGQVVHASTSSRPVYVTSVSGAGPNASGHRVTG
jgi:cell wall-associated NlpC family hydrolase